MGEVHSLIIRHGVEAARSMAATKAERNAIEAAASIMGEEESRIGITHAGFAMTSLPHKRIEETVWRRSGPNTTLLVASGHTEQGHPIGVPYGSIARLILLYLQTEAIRTGSAEVELGRSMNAPGSRGFHRSGRPDAIPVSARNPEGRGEAARHPLDAWTLPTLCLCKCLSSNPSPIRLAVSFPPRRRRCHSKPGGGFI
jgi:hypothetical protein